MEKGNTGQQFLAVADNLPPVYGHTGRTLPCGPAVFTGWLQVQLVTVNEIGGNAKASAMKPGLLCATLDKVKKRCMILNKGELHNVRGNAKEGRYQSLFPSSRGDRDGRARGHYLPDGRRCLGRSRGRTHQVEVAGSLRDITSATRQSFFIRKFF